MDAFRLLTNFILGILLTLAVQRWDLRRLDDEQRARSWNYATQGQALINFGPLSMLGWGWVTRRGKGLLLGAVTAVLIMFVVGMVDVLIVVLFGDPNDLKL
ncbi:MAG TPA: transcriptional regulator [Polyangium sp.]|nr:transcriptional regulator [Polyangium sp.]